MKPGRWQFVAAGDQSPKSECNAVRKLSGPALAVLGTEAVRSGESGTETVQVVQIERARARTSLGVMP